MPETRGFVALELLLALLLVVLCLHLYFDFSKRYNRQLAYTKNLAAISAAQSSLLARQDTISAESTLTTHSGLTCVARLVQNAPTPGVIYQEYEILRCD